MRELSELLEASALPGRGWRGGDCVLLIADV